MRTLSRMRRQRRRCSRCSRQGRGAWTELAPLPLASSTVAMCGVQLLSGLTGSHPPGSCLLQNAPVQVPIPGESSASPPPRAEAEVEGRAVGMEEQQAEAPQAAAPSQAGPPAAEREAPVIRQVSHVTEAAANMQAHAEEQAALPPPDRRRSSIGALGMSLHHR